ncbi:hypothetical protein [Saccharibacillus alkalitolerans]|uniref:YD repeat-containing protein n=1 Tax=Saccharibacillus alkalitolerans TaxID=2705290 RepID=A0ABX0FCP8_9BACL|nr:hypothetical protein [Saccharibacillus alkalitolerans]NGZ77914.1 hypothetical protein [Saccharibacillus alkalitolerans]
MSLLIKASSVRSETTYVYDAAGNVILENVNGLYVDLQMTYTAARRLTSTTPATA